MRPGDRPSIPYVPGEFTADAWREEVERATGLLGCAPSTASCVQGDELLWLVVWPAGARWACAHRGGKLTACAFPNEATTDDRECLRHDVPREVCLCPSWATGLMPTIEAALGVTPEEVEALMTTPGRVIGTIPESVVGKVLTHHEAVEACTSTNLIERAGGTWRKLNLLRGSAVGMAHDAPGEPSLTIPTPAVVGIVAKAAASVAERAAALPELVEVGGVVWRGGVRVGVVGLVSAGDEDEADDEPTREKTPGGIEITSGARVVAWCPSCSSQRSDPPPDRAASCAVCGYSGPGMRLCAPGHSPGPPPWREVFLRARELGLDGTYERDRPCIFCGLGHPAAERVAVLRSGVWAHRTCVEADPDVRAEVYAAPVPQEVAARVRAAVEASALDAKRADRLSKWLASTPRPYRGGKKGDLPSCDLCARAVGPGALVVGEGRHVVHADCARLARGT